jgi:hypothetical protein
VQKQLTYTCKEGGSCDINQYTRNKCQACRYQKCVDTGMLKEGELCRCSRCSQIGTNLARTPGQM